MNIVLPPINLPKFAARELTDSYKLVFDAPVEDYYGDEFDCKIYELEPHVKTIQVKNRYAVKKTDQFFTLAFPYLQFTIYKKTLYATVSKTGFVSPNYCGLHDLIINHFLYGYVCLPYEYIKDFDSPYGLINKFYSTSNRIGDTQYNSFERLKAWQKESQKPQSVMFSSSVLWKEKVFSLNEMITSSYDKPHQDHYGYNDFYKRPKWHDNHFTSYNELPGYRNNKAIREHLINEKLKLKQQEEQQKELSKQIAELPVPVKKRGRPKKNEN
mgnify:FL=1